MAEYIDLNGDGTYAERLGWAQTISPLVLLSGNIRDQARGNRLSVKVILVRGYDKLARQAAECPEVDMIGSAELHGEKDFMHQANSGIDLVIAKSAADNNIAVEFNFSNVLNSSGRTRAQLIARMAQNVRLCRKAHCLMLLTSGSKDPFESRGPTQLKAFGRVIGMTDSEAEDAITKNPSEILARQNDRLDPNALLAGLRVIEWGSKQKKKRIYGSY